MKKFLMMFCVALVCATVFDSCSKKDDDSNDPQNQIVGKWEATSHKETLDGNPIAGNDLDVIAEELVIEFNTNLSYTVMKKNVLVEVGTYTISGGTINFKPTGEEGDDYSYTFNVSDNKLHLFNPYGDYKGTYIEEIIFVRIN